MGYFLRFFCPTSADGRSEGGRGVVLHLDLTPDGTVVCVSVCERVCLCVCMPLSLSLSLHVVQCEGDRSASAGRRGLGAICIQTGKVRLWIFLFISFLQKRSYRRIKTLLRMNTPLSFHDSPSLWASIFFLAKQRNQCWVEHGVVQGWALELWDRRLLSGVDAPYPSPQPFLWNNIRKENNDHNNSHDILLLQWECFSAFTQTVKTDCGRSTWDHNLNQRGF